MAITAAQFEHLQSLFPGRDFVCLDVETYYDKGYSLTGMTYPEYIFDDRFTLQSGSIQINNGDVEFYRMEELEGALRDIDWENTVLVGQNLKFDASILKWIFGIEAAFYVDTMDLSNIWWPGQDASLDVISRRLWPDDPSMWKGKELASFKGFQYLNDTQYQVMEKYNNQDTNLTWHIFAELAPLIPMTELMLGDTTLRMYINPIFQLDTERVETFLAAEKKETAELVKASGLGKTILSSNPKFVAWMEEQGMEVPTKISPNTGKRTYALGQKDPGFLRLMADHPEWSHVWAARKAVKSTINQSRAQRLLDLDRILGFIPVPLKFWGAHTGRWSGTQKINMQNLPRDGELRKSLIVGDTHRIHVADSSNIEARVLAWLAGQMDLLDDFRRKVDVYSKYATMLYGYEVNRKLELDDGTFPFKQEGNVGKTMVLGLGYGMGDDRFRQTLASGPMGADPILVSAEFAQHAVDLYRSENPNIVNLWRIMDRVGYDMMMPGVDYRVGPLRILFEQIVLPNGTALKYPNLRIEDELDADGNPNGRRNLVCDRRNGKQKLYGGIITENVVQALSRIVVSDQVTAAVEELPDAIIALLVHDEGVVVLPFINDEQSQIWQEVFEDHLRVPPEWAPDLPLDAEGGYSTCYSK